MATDSLGLETVGVSCFISSRYHSVQRPSVSLALGLSHYLCATEKKKTKKQPGTGQPQDRREKKKTARDRTTLGPKKKKSLIESRCPFSLRTVIRLAIVQLCASHYRQFVTETGTVVLLLSSLACGHFGPHRLAHKSWAVFCL